MSRVSHSSMTSSLGRVPSRPRPPVVSGWSSGTTIFPDSVLTIGAPSASATAITSSRACRAPIPTSIATLDPALSTSAARASSASDGGSCGRLSVGMLAGAPPGPTCRYGSSDSGATWMSLGKVRCATVRFDSALRIARSTTPGSCCGLVTIRL